MTDDFETIVDIKKAIFRVVANGLRFVSYLKIVYHLKNINYFDFLYMLLSYEERYIISVRS